MAIREKYQEKDPITLLQVHNLIPYIGIIVSALGVYYTLKADVQLQGQRLSYLEASVNSCQVRIGTLESRVQQDELLIKELQTSKNVKGVSTSSGTIKVTPTPKGEE